MDRSWFFSRSELLVVSVVLYAITGEGDTIAGLPREDFPRLAGPLAILIFLMSGAARLTPGRGGQALKALGIWVAIALVLAGVYTYRVELGAAGDRVVEQLQPGSVQTISQGAGGRGTIVKIKKIEGHFIATAKVNGRTVHMIVDTGASTVVLRSEDSAGPGYSSMPSTIRFRSRPPTAALLPRASSSTRFRWAS